MKKLVVMLVVVLGAVLLPSAASQAQLTGVAGCENGVVVEGRCLTVDQQASLCSGTACLEHVEDSAEVCPNGATNLAADPLSAPICQLIEPAAQNGPGCPDGARGEAGDCFIYVALGPGGCPTLAVADAAGNCRRAVGNAAGAYYCQDDDGQLAGRDCITTPDPIPSPCPSGTARFGSACWSLNGLTAPETCAGHGVSGTITLASGLCQVPIAIPTGASTCTGSADYHEHPSFVLVNEFGDPQGDGPIEVACVDTSASIGLSVQSCFFTDDDHEWFDDGNGNGLLCTRYEQPDVATCPTGYSPDDSLGGICTRFESAVGGQCPNGGALNGQSCVFTIDFAQFVCPAGLVRDQQRPTCAAHRPRQWAAACGGTTALLLPSSSTAFGLNFGCFAYSGPQPDTCNGEGTLQSCFEIREPAPVDCSQTAGCIALSDFDVARCFGLVVTIDMNTNGGDGVGTAGDDVILGTPGDDVIDSGDGNDTVCARSGDDTVVGGNGDDTLFGQDGRDIMRGGPGTDEMHGGADDDRVLGGIGDDTMSGGLGDDFLGGFGGADTIDGGLGDERIFGGFGPDVINGGPGNDVISGLIGDDTINGNEGNDTLNGDRGNDTINGDDGNDTINGGNANDFLTGGTGDDRLNGGRADDTLSGGFGTDTCVGNNQHLGDTADATCEQTFGIP